jgi:Tfp pilus assembly protein PilF
LRLYDLQRAYVLGYLAHDAPDEYLQPAIEQYRAIQASDPSFYVGQINLAALYAQAGDLPNAQATLQAALPIRSDLALVRLQLGRVAEAQGQEDEALRWYQAALEPASPWVGSEFWQSTPLRQQAWAANYAALDAATQVLWAVDQNREAEAAEAVKRIGTPQTHFQHNALAYYAAWQGDFLSAVQWYEASLETVPMQPWTAAQLATAYYGLGDLEQAEHQARLALFLTQYADPFQRINQVAYVRGGSAAYILAQLAIQDGSATDQQINDWLFQAVETLPLYQSYEDVVFSQAAYLPYLPQVEVLGGNERAYAPWLLLAQRYASDDDPQTDPAEVYEAIQAADPYVVGAGF